MSDLQTARENAAKYLADHFNPQVGLINESPHVNPNLYWLNIDNYLALKALGPLNVPLQQQIIQTFAKYQPPPHGRVEIIFDQPQPEPFRYGIHYIVERIPFSHMGPGGAIETSLGIYTIETEVSTGIPIVESGYKYELESSDESQHVGEALTYGNYGDILCYAAMNRRLGVGAPKSFWDWLIPPKSATELLQQANNLWDGLGINDAYRQAQPDGHYAMYKLALNVIANLKFGLQPNPALVERLLSINTTDYLPDGTPLGDENCESWSFKLIALNMLLQAS